jgi:hypothetical protein
MTAASGGDAAPELSRRRHPGWPLAGAYVLALATLVTGVLWATTAAAGADAHGYVSQADRWLAGRLTIDQSWAADAPWRMARWTLAPLGYRPSVAAGDEWVLVPAYSPGLPLLLALAKFIGGQELMFWVVPLFGAILVLATYGLTRRLVTPGAGLIAAWLVATSPTVLFMLMAPMSDVPAAAAWAVAFFTLLDRRLSSSIAAGLAAGLAILIRPNLAPGAAILAAWCAARLVKPGTEGRGHALAAGAGFAAGAISGALIVAAVNQSLNGSPFISGYGSLEDAFSPRFLWPNLVRYGTWLVETQTPLVLAGALALLLPIRAVWPAATERAAPVAMATFVAFVWLSYAFYREYDAWWFLRFLLPSWPFLMAGSAAVLHLIAARGRLARLAVVIGVVALGLWQVHVAIDRHAFTLWKDERRYVTVARHVEQLTEPGSAIFSRQHSGSIRYYAGRLTVRFEEFEPGDLDRAVAWFAARGVRSYLLLDDADMAIAREVLAGQAASRMREPPLLHYSGTAQVYFYELSHPRDRAIPTMTVREDGSNTRSVPPSPLATSNFAPAR